MDSYNYARDRRWSAGCGEYQKKNKTVKIDRAEKIASLLDQYEIEHDYHIMHGAGHAFIYGEKNTAVRDEAMEMGIDFLDQYLR
jgi:hypothetical protein